jgi:glutamate-1-semialdehyde 2,1-aminomutase
VRCRPRQAFEGIVAAAHEKGALVIFDEVITAESLWWRAGALGAPDLTCLGKIVGGGLSVGVSAVAPSFDLRAPTGPVYQAGTLAGIHRVRRWKRDAATSHRARISSSKSAAPRSSKVSAARSKRPERARRCNAWADADRVFGVSSVRNYVEAASCDTAAFALLSGHARARYLPAPSQFEAWFVSLAHGDGEIAQISRGTRGLGAS